MHNAFRRFCVTLGLLLVAAPTLAALPAALDATAPLPSLAPMLQRVMPAVVNISTQGHVAMQRNPLLNDPFFRRFFNAPDQPAQRRTQASGSGVIVDANRGLILTNNHVIANADQISVRLNDGRSLTAKLVGTDPETDIAVIQVTAPGLTALKLANSDGARVGDFVVAIGNPFGLGQTVTSGIVSALARSGLGITKYDDLIQTDASINPGNSGGALVTLGGELLGINTAIYSQSGGNIGIGFAIPIKMANQVMEQLVQYGEVKRGYLGAEMQNLDPELAAAFGIEGRGGAVLVNILPGSQADKAGLQAGDVVTALNGKPVRDASDLRNQIALKRVGDPVKLEVFRDGKRLDVASAVGAREAPGGREGMRNARLAGVTVDEIPEDAPMYGSVSGVLVRKVAPNSPAWKAGLREGDIVMSVNRADIDGVSAFVAVVTQIKGQLLLHVLRGNQTAYLVIR